MRYKLNTLALCVLLSFAAQGQHKKEKVLLEIDEQPVYHSEFIRLFSKNNSLKTAGQKPSIESDLELFIDYKLKVLEAKKLKLDTMPSYLTEVAKYREQLMEPYLTDNSYVDSLVQQAYDRSLKEIKASHILIKSSKKSKDTAQAFAKISQLRTDLLAGADFSKLAKQHSEDPSAIKNGGDLGYFSVFRMVHPFEDAAYKTPVGEVSNIFRTRFGYHIMKVTDLRDSKGEIEVAHIMIRDTTSNGKSTIDKVHRQIQNGEAFEELSKKYSDDRRSANKGGRLQRFTLGALPPPFGEISFSLSEEKKYSQPFRTAFGWHVVKFIKHYPIKTFEEVEKELFDKVKKDSRSQSLANPVAERLKKEYSLQTNLPAKEALKAPEQFGLSDSSNSWLLVVEKDTLTQNDLRTFAKTKNASAPLSVFDAFVDDQVLSYYKSNLETTNEEYKNLFNEYKNGLLLFDLMELKVWGAAQKDSLGLEAFYTANLENYKTKATANALVLTTKNSKEIEELQVLLKNSSNVDSLKTVLEGYKDVLVKAGDLETESSIFPQKTDFSKHSLQIYHEKDNHVLVKIMGQKEAIPQPLGEVKGKVISDYQNQIQEDWLRSLRTQHSVKINKRRLRKIKKQLSFYE
jgi:peptidyl-prolyl cis-trans isomerase SurA